MLTPVIYVSPAAMTVVDDATVADMVNTLGGATSTGTGGLVRSTSPALAGTPTAPTAAALTSTTQLATTAFVTGAVATAITGTLKFMGATDCSSNPNYPAASKGDVYVVSVAGKIGGASGTPVDVGDEYFATADNAGGTQAAVGGSWATLEHNLAGALLSANNLSDLASAPTARTNLGLGTLATQSGTFSGSHSGTSSGTNTGDQTGANPSASVGLTAVNGSASTFMRSDGAPALDQTAAYVLSALGITTVLKAGIAATSTDGLILSNTTAAAAGVQQWSPRLHWTGKGWATNSGGSSQTCDWIAEVQPVQGTANPTSNLVFSSQVNAGGYTARATLTSGGQMLVGDGARVTPAVAFASAPTIGMWNDSGAIRFSINGIDIFWIGSTGVDLGTAKLLTFGGNPGFGKSAAGVVEVNTGTAGTFAALICGNPATSVIGHIVKGIASRTVALMQLQTSAGASIGNVGGTVANDFTDINSASTDGTTEDTLATYTSPANCLIINGDSLEEVEHIITVASATNTRRIKKYFAGTLIFDSGLLTLTLGGDFTIWTTIIRESSTVVRCDVSVTTTSASTVPYSTYTRITGLTLTGTNVLVTKCLVGGGTAAAADVVEKLSKTWCSAAA